MQPFPLPTILFAVTRVNVPGMPSPLVLPVLLQAQERPMWTMIFAVTLSIATCLNVAAFVIVAS
jgi:hypothetical protein